MICKSAMIVYSIKLCFLFFLKHDEVNLAQSSVPSSEMDSELLITMVTNATNAILTRLQSTSLYKFSYCKRDPYRFCRLSYSYETSNFLHMKGAGCLLVFDRELSFANATNYQFCTLFCIKMKFFRVLRLKITAKLKLQKGIRNFCPLVIILLSEVLLHHRYKISTPA